jgi:hypothetical protein
VAVRLLSTPMESRQGRVQERFVSYTIYEVVKLSV